MQMIQAIRLRRSWVQENHAPLSFAHDYRFVTANILRYDSVTGRIVPWNRARILRPRGFHSQTRLHTPIHPIAPHMAARNDAKNRPNILIVGAGGHGRVVLDILTACNTSRVVGFLDSNTEIRGRRIDGVPVLGHPDQLEPIAQEYGATAIVVAIGDNGIRRGIARRVDASGLSLANAIHPSATIAHNAVIGRNVVIAAGAVVCANCQVGDSVILNTGCIADYQCMIGEGAHICPGVRIAARVKVEPGAFLGTAATVVPRVCIGYEAVVGAGAVVLDDVPPMGTVVGVPARLIRLDAASEEDVAMLLPALSSENPPRTASIRAIATP